jgi:hypothetical protein
MTTAFMPFFRGRLNGTVIGFSDLFNKIFSVNEPEAASTRKVRLSTEEEPK